jgi:hypothetical protein
LNDFPKQDTVLKTEKGDATFIKMDIFKNLLWYTYRENRNKWYKLTLEQVKEIIDLNKNQEKIASLEEYELELIEEIKKVDFENVVGQDSLTRFDAPKSNKKRRNKNKKPQHANAQKRGNNPPKQGPRPPKKKKVNPNNPVQKQATNQSTNAEVKPTNKNKRNKKRRPPRNPANNQNDA